MSPLQPVQFQAHQPVGFPQFVGFEFERQPLVIRPFPQINQPGERHPNSIYPKIAHARLIITAANLGKPIPPLAPIIPMDYLNHPAHANYDPALDWNWQPKK
jgi:hypothetical protein